MMEVVLLVCLVCVLYEELELSYSNPEGLIRAHVVGGVGDAPAMTLIGGRNHIQ